MAAVAVWAPSLVPGGLTKQSLDVVLSESYVDHTLHTEPPFHSTPRSVSSPQNAEKQSDVHVKESGVCRWSLQHRLGPLPGCIMTIVRWVLFVLSSRPGKHLPSGHMGGTKNMALCQSPSKPGLNIKLLAHLPATIWPCQVTFQVQWQLVHRQGRLCGQEASAVPTDDLLNTCYIHQVCDGDAHQQPKRWAPCPGPYAAAGPAVQQMLLKYRSRRYSCRS